MILTYHNLFDPDEGMRVLGGGGGGGGGEMPLKVFIK